MTPEEAAAQLHGTEYGNEGPMELPARMKSEGLVAVYGASDDLVEFRGAIHDEVGAYNGTEVMMTPNGLLQNKCDEGDDCPNWTPDKHGAKIIKAIWCPEGDEKMSWAYETAIPHVTFDIMEDGEIYCRGIVFRLSDV